MLVGDGGCTLPCPADGTFCPAAATVTRALAGRFIPPLSRRAGVRWLRRAQPLRLALSAHRHSEMAQSAISAAHPPPGGGAGAVSPARPARRALFWGCQMGWDGGHPGSGTQSCFTHSSVKNVTLLGAGFFFLLLAFPPPFSTQLLMRQFAGARQTQTGTARLLPGGQALGAGKQGNVALLV